MSTPTRARYNGIPQRMPLGLDQNSREVVIENYAVEADPLYQIGALLLLPLSHKGRRFTSRVAIPRDDLVSVRLVGQRLGRATRLLALRVGLVALADPFRAPFWIGCARAILSRQADVLSELHAHVNLAGGYFLLPDIRAGKEAEAAYRESEQRFVDHWPRKS